MLLGRAVAVLAAVIVAGEHRPPVERRVPAVRHPHEAAQADDRRHRDDEVGGVHESLAGVEHLGGLAQHEDDRPAVAHDAEGSNVALSTSARVIAATLQAPDHVGSALCAVQHRLDQRGSERHHRR
jgi:hypothetical protein